MEKTIIYFDKPGLRNTSALLKAAKTRLIELGIKDIVIATTHGDTVLKAIELFDDSELNIVAVTNCMGFFDRPNWIITQEEKKNLEKRGVKVITAGHALGDGVASAFANKYRGRPIVKIITDTLRRFSQGMKVCVEISLMAADSGLIPMDKEIMTIAGTDRGADTCIVVKPTYPRKFFELEIREIIAKPRNLS